MIILLRRSGDYCANGRLASTSTEPPFEAVVQDLDDKGTFIEQG